MNIKDEELFTQCPHCRTPFKALHASTENWVKCGRCHKVFNAKANKVDSSQINTIEIEQQLTDLKLTNVISKKKRGGATQADLFEEQAQNSAEEINKQTKSTSESTNKAKFPDRKGFKKNRFNPPVKKGKYRINQTKFGSNKAPPAINSQSKNKSSKSASESKYKSYPAIRVVTEVNNQPEQRDAHQTQKAAKTIESLWLKSRVRNQQGIKDKPQVRSHDQFKRIIFSLLLFFLLFWQVNIVSYYKLLNYDFIKPGLSVICSVLACNSQPLSKDQIFEIFQAAIKPHPQLPDVLNLSARLINYSDTDQLLPKMILQLTNSENNVIAYKIINLAENPQYVDPPVSQLIPGQDVKLIFNIDQPTLEAVGFKLNLQP